MKKLFLLAALCVAAAFSSCSKHDNEINHVEPPVPPETTPLAIAFAEGNSLEFNVGETKTVHYTITGGSENTVVKAELQTPDDAYTVETTPASTSEGTITITAQTPETENCVIVTVSAGSQTIMAAIAVTLKASFDGKTAVVVTPGTLAELLSGYDTAQITELTVIGNLNDEDIKTLKNLSKLAVLDMENVNLEVLPNQAFWKTSLTSVKLPKTLKIIGNYAFYFCSSLTSVTIPESVTEIGDYAFYGCSSLTSVTIPDSIKSLLPQTFSNCSNLNAFYGKFASSDNRCLIIGSTLIDFAPAGLTSYTIPDSVTSIGDSAFSGCSSLTSITIPNSVTSIGDSAFYSCSNLTSITIPSSVRNIERCAFSGCSNLTSVTIPNSVTTIGEMAFYNCSGLKSVTIGNSVTSIGYNAFQQCLDVTSIYCKATVPPSVPNYAFCAFKATLYVPTGCKVAYVAAGGGWSIFKTIEETQF
ncbi:leucine-rich repeat domain-containing protein [uncultured Alistipes sp.]|uniref:leucine-rich repeat domain-containing protein n=1 Tax=uncultured Alistipes sp. TaxID=538949 RepID=UPI00272C9A36|nr:leucine-rich repeat domain-containing protein [uncultured Alistipes sp.]